MEIQECIGKTSRDNQLTKWKLFQSVRYYCRNMQNTTIFISRNIQVYFLFLLMISQGLFFLSDGFQDQSCLQSIISGIYLISLSIIWLFLLLFFKNRKMQTKNNYHSNNRQSSTSSHNSKKSMQQNNLQDIQQINGDKKYRDYNIQNDMNNKNAQSEFNEWNDYEERNKYKEYNKQNQQQTQSINMWHIDLLGTNKIKNINMNNFNANAYTNNNNIGETDRGKTESVAIHKVSSTNQTTQTSKNQGNKRQMTFNMNPLLKDLIIIIFSLPAIILMYQLFLESNNQNKIENSENDTLKIKYWTGVLSWISLKLMSYQIKKPILQVAYVFCGFSYFIIQYWIKFGFVTEVICLSILISIQQLTYQIADFQLANLLKIFNSPHLRAYFFEALRITLEMDKQEDSINKIDAEAAAAAGDGGGGDYSNRSLLFQTSQFRKSQIPRILTQIQEQNLKQNLNLDNQSYQMQQLGPKQFSEQKNSRSFLDKGQASNQFTNNNVSYLSNNNPPLKRTTTLNQKINELKMGGFYSQLFGLIPVGVAIINSNKNLLYASSQILQMLNCQDEQKALKILLNLNTNAQKSTQFMQEDETESDEDEEHFYSPINCHVLSPSVNTCYMQNGMGNISEKFSQTLKKETENISQISSNLSSQQQKAMQQQQQQQQYNQQQQLLNNTPLGSNQSQLIKNGKDNQSYGIYIDENRYMMCGDEEEDNQTNRKVSITYNLGSNNNNNNNTTFNHNNSNLVPQMLNNKSVNLQKDQSSIIMSNTQLDLKNHQNMNGSMYDIGTERKCLIMPNSQSAFLPQCSSQQINSQQQLGSISARRIKRKSTYNFTNNKDMREDRWITEEKSQSVQQHSVSNLYRQQSNPQAVCSSTQFIHQQNPQPKSPYLNIAKPHTQNYFDIEDRSERQIIEEEELGLNGSIINPEITINELQFQKPEYSKINSPKSGIDSTVLRKRGSSSMHINLKQKNALKSNQDNGSDNKTEAQQREESVFNILNVMLGQNEQNSNNNNNNNNTQQFPQVSSTRIKSQKKIQTNQYPLSATYCGQNQHPTTTTSVEPDMQQSPLIYAKHQFQNQSTAATHSQNFIQQKQQQEQQMTNDMITNSLAKQLDINREKQSSNFKINNATLSQQNLHQNESEYQYGQEEGGQEDVIQDQNHQKQAHPPNSTSSKKRQTEEGKQEFDDLLKQKQKLGYIQQEGNVSIMQIEYLGEQYILKIIIQTIIVGQTTEQKVAILVMEKMWQDFMIKRVEDLISQKMQLFGSLSHELRTPLNCSISMLEVINNISRQDPKNQKQLGNYIQPALNSNKLLLNMINDILDFVQLDNGSFKFGLVEFDLQNLLKECVSLVQIQAQMKNLTIACYYDPQTPKIIKSDPNRIRQVVLNFLSNSLKFTVTGHIIVYASAHKGVQEVTIGVKDTGIGINQENIKEIFKIFNKIDLGDRQKLNLQGCGVGLALSNNIARALGPENNQGIQVESKKDEGSTFSFVVLNKNPAIVQKEEDIYENDDISHERLFANCSIIRPKVTQIIKDNILNKKNKKGRNRNSSNPTFQQQNSLQNINTNTNTNKGSIHQIRLSVVTQPNSNQFDNTNIYQSSNLIQQNTKIIGLDGMNMGSDSSLQFNYVNEPTRKMRSVSLTQTTQTQRKLAINTFSASNTIREQQSPDQINEKQQQKNSRTTNYYSNYPQSPSKNNGTSYAHPSLISIYNNPTEKKQSLLETIKSKDFQDMHLLDHSKYDSPAGFNSYHNDSDAGIIKKSIESIQNDIQQCGCTCASILIVDDQEFNLFSLSELLKQFYGIISDTAVNEAQVLQKISDKLNSNCCKTYRIIFMDINMPQKNGYEVAREITYFYKNHKNLDTIKPTIIACSAYNGEEDKKKAHQNGMIDFVTKPIMKVALDAIVSKYYEFQTSSFQHQLPH